MRLRADRLGGTVLRVALLLAGSVPLRLRLRLGSAVLRIALLLSRVILGTASLLDGFVGAAAILRGALIDCSAGRVRAGLLAGAILAGRILASAVLGLPVPRRIGLSIGGLRGGVTVHARLPERVSLRVALLRLAVLARVVLARAVGAPAACWPYCGSTGRWPEPWVGDGPYSGAAAYCDSPCC